MNGGKMYSGAFYGTFLDQWPSDVLALSIPTQFHTLSDDDIYALLSQHTDIRTLIAYQHRLKFSNRLLQWIDHMVQFFDHSAFARLGACSFITQERKPQPIHDGEQVVKLMMHLGIRAASLSYRCFLAKRPIVLCVREWHNIQPWSEFRIFIKNREVLGISQYHWRCIFPTIEEKIEFVVDALYHASTCISAKTHLKSVVADIYIADLDKESPWVLIELNPYSIASDSCLFTWNNGGDFDGTFRYRLPNGGMNYLPLPFSKRRVRPLHRN
jgi:hypothetical protein